ncbi:MAG: hypothetical protein K2Y37_05640 [Pirellulales bacterium]|nr:hypothetical protein [Pirellulales bacterium]
MFCARSCCLRRALLGCWCALAVSGAIVLFSSSARFQSARAEPAATGATGAADRARVDPAAWGDDHVGQEVPEYVDIGECLFCHRKDVGGSWDRNRHSRTIHDAPAGDPAMKALAADPAGKSLVGEVQLLLGGRQATRFVRRAEQFGHADLLSAMAVPAERGNRFRIVHPRIADVADKPAANAKPHWDHERFANRCAGCHATAVDPETRNFATVSLDCCACHGDGPLEHSNEPELMPLAKTRKDSPQVVISICASCHIRFGESKATGRPYATNFVAGDNLFRDFRWDWALADDAAINPGDRHVLDLVREVALFGNGDMTCLSCHEVHPGTSLAHRKLPRTAYCAHCHEPGKPLTEHKRYVVHSKLCEY